MLVPADVAPAKLRPLLRSEYDQLVDLGAFVDQKIELLRGQLVEMSPQGEEHGDAVWWLGHHLSRMLDPRDWEVRTQLPFAATSDSEPEPDVFITRGRRHRSRQGHPSVAELVIEVARSSQRLDRTVKRRLYAEANVPEYWIVDVHARVVEIFTQPADGDYLQVRQVASGFVEAMHVPGVRIAVDHIPGIAPTVEP